MLWNEAAHLCMDCLSPQASLIIGSSFTEEHKTPCSNQWKCLGILCFFQNKPFSNIPGAKETFAFGAGLRTSMPQGKRLWKLKNLWKQFQKLAMKSQSPTGQVQAVFSSFQPGSGQVLCLFAALWSTTFPNNDDEVQNCRKQFCPLSKAVVADREEDAAHKTTDFASCLRVSA